MKANPRKLSKEPNVHASTVSRHLEQIGKFKKLKKDKWLPYKLNENQQNRRFEVASTLLLLDQKRSFSGCDLQ